MSKFLGAYICNIQIPIIISTSTSSHSLDEHKAKDKARPSGYMMAVRKKYCTSKNAVATADFNKILVGCTMYGTFPDSQ